MTQSTFDPRCLGQYPASNPPKFFHFEFEGSTSIHRYMLVDRIPVNDINPATKRCQNEGDDESLRRKYVHPIEHIGDIEPEKEHSPEPEPATLPSEEAEDGQTEGMGTDPNGPAGAGQPEQTGEAPATVEETPEDGGVRDVGEDTEAEQPAEQPPGP